MGVPQQLDGLQGKIHPKMDDLGVPPLMEPPNGTF